MSVGGQLSHTAHTCHVIVLCLPHPLQLPWEMSGLGLGCSAGSVLMEAGAWVWHMLSLKMTLACLNFLRFLYYFSIDTTEKFVILMLLNIVSSF